MTNRRENARKKTKETLLCTVGWIASIIQIAASVFSVVLLCRADLLPIPFLTAGIAVLAVLIVVCRLLMKRRIKKGRFFCRTACFPTNISSIMCGGL